MLLPQNHYSSCLDLQGRITKVLNMKPVEVNVYLLYCQESTLDAVNVDIVYD